MEILPFYAPTSTKAQAPIAWKLKVMQVNLLDRNTAYSQASVAIEQMNPDILSLQEATPTWLAHLAPVLKKYRYRMTAPELYGTAGRGLYSKFPLRNTRFYTFAPHTAPGLVATIQHQGQQATVLTVHPKPPVIPLWLTHRNAQLNGIAQARSTWGENVIMIGDLNNSPYSPSFRHFIQSTGLKDARLGQGLHPSWPSVFPLLWIPIDHVLVSPTFRVLHYQTGPYIGSDHFPVMVELGLTKQH